jgi:hypothetical protein
MDLDRVLLAQGGQCRRSDNQQSKSENVSD